MMLQDHDWKLDMAINAYFATTAAVPDGKEVVVSTKPPSQLKILSWNIGTFQTLAE